MRRSVHSECLNRIKVRVLSSWVKRFAESLVSQHAVAAHEEAIRQYMKDYGANFRILDEPLLVTGIGVAFSRHDTRGLAAQLDEVFEQMREDGSMEKLAGKYLDDPTHSLEVDALEQ